MKKAVVLGSTLWFLCGLVGCSSDNREKLIKDVITRMTGAAETLGTVKTQVTAAVNEAKKANPPRTVTEADLKKAVSTANDAVKLGKEMQQLRLIIEGKREATTDEQRREWARKYQNEVQQAAERLVKSQRELNATLQDLEVSSTAAKAAVEPLRKALEEVQQEFEAVTKQT
jgi:hypothetical protein